MARETVAVKVQYKDLRDMDTIEAVGEHKELTRVFDVNIFLNL